MDFSASTPFTRAFDYASDRTGRRFQNPVYFITELFTGSRLRSSLAEVRDFGRQIISNAQKGRSERAQVHDTSDPEYGSLVHSLMDTFKDDTSVAADAALNFLSAGRDTTAQSLTWTFYCLMRHPAAVTTLREETDSAFSASSLPQDVEKEPPRAIPPLKLGVADLQPTNLPRTMSIFNESLRLHPPVPFEIKQCQVDTRLPDDTFLPKGSIIIWCIWAMNRSRHLWGDDSDRFRPERWLAPAADQGDGDGADSAVKLITKTAFEFPVFNGGPRSCLGKKMAELMACWILVQMWRDFEFEEIIDTNKTAAGGQGTPERRSKNSLTLPMEGGLPCHVRLRGERDSGLDREPEKQG